jgi:anaerobic magnesium-protoporphyrin IX monomethyl ester cyclase
VVTEVRVLFVSINKLRSYRPVLPTGMVTVATQVRAAGHDVRCLDLMFEDDDEGVVRQAVGAFTPDLVGIAIRNVDSLNLLEPAVYTPIAAEVAEWVRQVAPETPILLGGAGFTLVPEDLMDFVRAEYGLTGFAESSAVMLLDRLQRGAGVENVPGVIVPLAAGGYHRQPPAFAIDYDRVLEPDPALYDPRYRSYTYETLDGFGRVPVAVQTKKGCVLACAYCSNALIDGPGVRLNRPERVADEIERLRDAGEPGYEIIDGVFNLPLPYAMQVLCELDRRRARLPWSAMINPGAVTPELVDLMARTGCEQVEIGTDSCDDQVLRALGKNYRCEQVVRAHRRFVDAGIRVMQCLFIGSPGDDRSSVLRTFDVIGELVPPDASRAKAYWTFGLRIARGTRLHDLAVAAGVIPPDQRFLVPSYYVSPAVAEDADLLVETRTRMLAHPSWYLWWGLSHVDLAQRIRLATVEHREIERMLLDHLTLGSAP